VEEGGDSAADVGMVQRCSLLPKKCNIKQEEKKKNSNIATKSFLKKFD
jgi:hypothetical protein